MMRPALLLLSLLAAAAPAQEAPLTEPALPEFAIELLVFRHLTPADDELLPEADPATDPDSADTDTEPVPLLTRVGSLPPQSLQLTAINDKLRRSRNFSPIMHHGWSQPVAPREEAGAVPVAGNRDTVFVRGTARLSLQRYLHLELDLEMAGSDGTPYHLHQSRRLRSGDLHYFDHPHFGVIALVHAPN